MALSGFQEQFSLLAGQQMRDEAVFTEATRIKQILQKPVTSIHEAFRVLNEIHTSLSATEECHQFSQDVRLLVEGEMKRLRSIARTAEQTFSEIEGSEDIQSPFSGVIKQEPLSLFALQCCDTVYLSYVWPSSEISEEILEMFYSKVVDTARKLVDEHKAQELLNGRPENEVEVECKRELDAILAKLQKDRDQDMHLVHLFVEEEKNTVPQYRFKPLARSWSGIRTEIRDWIEVVRYMKGLPLPEGLRDIGSQKSPVGEFLQHHMDLEREKVLSMIGLLLKMPQEPAINLFNALLRALTEEASFPIKGDYFETMTRLNRSESWSGIFPDVPEAILEEFKFIFLSYIDSLFEASNRFMEDLHQKITKEPDEGLRSYKKNILECVGLKSFLALQDEIKSAYKEGISIDFFKKYVCKDIFLNEESSIQTQKPLFEQIRRAHQHLKACGCDKATSEQILSLAIFEGKDLQLKKVIGMPKELVLKFIQNKDKIPSWTTDTAKFLSYWTEGSSSVLSKLMKYDLLCLLSRFNSEELLKLFREMTDAEVDTVLDAFSEQIRMCTPETIKKILESKERREFFLRVIDRHANFSIVLSAIELFEVLYANAVPSPSISENILALSAKLTIPERVRFLRTFPCKEMRVQYAAESIGVFEPIIERLSLQSVATEPLVRFLFEMPFQQASAWLDQQIDTASGKVSRLSTLTDKQKLRILDSFPRHNSRLPIKPWLEKFGITEEQVQQMRARVNREVSSEPRMPCPAGIDVNDPTGTLFKVLRTMVGITVPELIFGMFLSAKEESICGENTVLTWGNASPTTSPFTAQDSVPLHARINGDRVVLYQSGALNDFSCAVPAVMLRRKIITLFDESPQVIAKLGECLRYRNEPDDVVIAELYYEILRIARHLEEANPEFPSERVSSLVPPTSREGEAVGDVPAPSMRGAELPDSTLPVAQVAQGIQGPPAASSSAKFSTINVKELSQLLQASVFQESTSFLELLQGVYKTCLGSPHLASIINPDNYAHTDAILFFSLLLVARNTQMRATPGVVDVALSPAVHFHLKHVPRDYEIPREDNPGFTGMELETLRQNYAPHTLSPITPGRDFPPQMFQKFVESVQKLSEQDFYLLCVACTSLFSISEDDAMFLGVPQFLTKWENAFKKIVPEFVLTKDIKLLIEKITNNYAALIAWKKQPLTPGQRIIFNPFSVEDYVPEDQVPKFVRSTGNYASAICQFMVPQDTRLHDGNCGVNAFLIGLYGPALSDEVSCPTDQLRARVHEFRHSVVEYARANKDQLKKKFGEEEVTSLIDSYESEIQVEWTKTIVWECAAKIYGREIFVYGSPAAAGSTFSIGEKGEVEPTAVFRPDGKPEEPPINLMHWEVHYCCLQRKEK